MRKQQRIQLWQFVAAWILIYLFCTFVVKQSFVDVVLKYRFFFLVASVSYFYYYSIQYEPDKKYELIRKGIIYGNLYLFAHVFFRPLLNIPDALFVLLWLIILWFWWTTKMKSRRKYLLQAVWFVFSFFILVSGTLYFYPNKPDIEWYTDLLINKNAKGCGWSLSKTVCAVGGQNNLQHPLPCSTALGEGL